jgi:hypothetical protein
MRTLLAIVAALAFAPFAAAGTATSPVAEALRADPVYVDADAERALTESQTDELRAAIDDAGGDIYVAVLPASSGDNDGILRELYDAVGREGTYAVVVGNRFRAGNNGALRREVPQLADAALRARGAQGAHATLLDFVDRVGAARDGRATAPDEQQEDDEGLPVLPIILIGGGGLAAYALYRQRRRRTEDERRQLAAVRELTEEDLVALADDVKDLDLDVSMPSAPAAAREHYERALTLYERANADFDRALRPSDVERVTANVADGRWEMAAARAALEGRAVPERNPPCFFDPRHGPASRFVEWAPPGGAPRDVPACEADAQRVERGLEPQTREVTVDGTRRPYYEAPLAAPWAMGFFGASLLPTLMIGSMIGTSLGLGFPGGAFGGGYEGDAGDHAGDGGDFGGGDFGGGDFGGGDFGGGD